MKLHMIAESIPQAPNTLNPSTTPVMTPGLKMVITKLVNALKTKKIEPSAFTTGNAIMKYAGMVDQEFAMLKRSGLLQRDPESGGYSIDTNKLSEVRRQNGIN